MRDRQTRVAGLDTWLIGEANPELRIVFLHGCNMGAADLTPFAHSLAIPRVAYAFPQAPESVSASGYAWWPSTRATDGVEAEIARDLWQEQPRGRDRARAMLREFMDALRRHSPEPTLLAGFSQGGMLACDTVLLEDVEVAGLALMSSSCIALGEWEERSARLAGMPAFISHGRHDPDLSFAAGQRLSRFLTGAGARLTWAPFDGGHSIPLPVWRQFKQFVQATLRAAKEDTRAHSLEAH
jgi:phospholipase/carboxylesterase